MSAKDKLEAWTQKSNEAKDRFAAYKEAVHQLNECIKAYAEREFGARVRCTLEPSRRVSLTGPVEGPYELENLKILLNDQLLITVKATTPDNNSVKIECGQAFATLLWTGGPTLSDWKLRASNKPGRFAISNLKDPPDTVSLPESEGLPLDESILGRVFEQLIPD
jgi:hypothetical protein